MGRGSSFSTLDPDPTTSRVIRYSSPSTQETRYRHWSSIHHRAPRSTFATTSPAPGNGSRRHEELTPGRRDKLSLNEGDPMSRLSFRVPVSAAAAIVVVLA